MSLPCVVMCSEAGTENFASFVDSKDLQDLEQLSSHLEEDDELDEAGLPLLAGRCWKGRVFQAPGLSNVRYFGRCPILDSQVD